jgi:hypothetical protein
MVGQRWLAGAAREVQGGGRLLIALTLAKGPAAAVVIAETALSLH